MRMDFCMSVIVITIELKYFDVHNIIFFGGVIHGIGRGQGCVSPMQNNE